MKIVIHKDGSIEFPEGIPQGMLLKSYRVDENNPNLFIPKFQPCIHRLNKCRMSPCGRRAVFDWRCNLFKKQITIVDCEKCNAPKE